MKADCFFLKKLSPAKTFQKVLFFQHNKVFVCTLCCPAVCFLQNHRSDNNAENYFLLYCTCNCHTVLTEVFLPCNHLPDHVATRTVNIHPSLGEL